MGQGTVKFTVLVDRIKALGYDDTITLEVFDADRRMLRAAVSGLEYSIERDTLELAFRLGSGCYATSLLRELLDATDVTRSVSIDD